MILFSDIPLIDPLQKSLKDVGYKNPTPIQEQTIPLVLQGHDLLGIAQTGTGKTAAFCLPLLQKLALSKSHREPRSPKALILAPTRELAIQVHESLRTYGKFLSLKHAVIFGGVGQGAQVQALRNGVDVLVATPGRLLDLIDQRHLKLNKVEVFILDEADRMLDMGFMRDIQKILPLLPTERHNLFFSATMPKEIQNLASKILKDPKKVEVTPPSTTVERIHQVVMYVDQKNKPDLLIHLIKEMNLKKVLVFVGMKHLANRVVEKLDKNRISAAAIHGNKSQGARQRALQDFSEGRARVLVATDIASRGIDIDGITHVINFDMSNLAEAYVHRIGRTARAGKDGTAISLVTGEERSYLVNVERTTRQELEVVTDHPYHSEAAMNARVMGVGKAKALIEGKRKSHRSRGSSGPSRSADSRSSDRPKNPGGPKRSGGHGKKKSSARKRFTSRP
jgi:ATP-dependent RNA helicase RhlE